MEKTNLKMATMILIVIALLGMSESALAVKAPDIPLYCGVYYTSNTKPNINLNFSTSVNLIESSLERGSNEVIPLNYDATNLLSAFLVTINGSFTLIPSAPTTKAGAIPLTKYTYYLNAKTKKGIELDDDQKLCMIVVDINSPNITIYPNNRFFTKSTDVNLTFNVTFNELAKLDNVTINGKAFTDFDMEKYASSHSRKPTVMTAANKALFTSDGIKRIHINAEDLAENKVSGDASFEINANKTLTIELLKPKYGKSPTKQFEFIIGTDNPAECKYYLDGDRLNYDTMTSKLAPSADKTQHVGSITLDDEEEGHFFWIGCYDPFFKESTYATIPIGVDTTKPSIISAYALPEEIVEPPLMQGSLLTTLYVNTDDDTICRYDTSASSFSEMKNDFDESHTFSQVHKVTVNITSTDTKNYNYNIACLNKAELEATKTIPFLVDLNAKLKITLLTQKFQNSPVLDLKIKINKNSTCFYSANQSASKNDSFNFQNDTGYFFSNILSLGRPGNYTFYINCENKRNPEKASLTAFFIVDVTPPLVPFVDDSSPINDSQYHYSNKSLRVNYSSNDPETGIKRFTVRIVEKDTLENVTSWKENSDSSTWGKWIKYNGLNLVNLKTYIFQVTATNWAELTSNPGESDGVTIDQSKIPEYCSNSQLDSIGETDIDCGDTCPVCDIGKKCRLNDDCTSEYCKAGICVQATCTDGIRNQHEGDIDCGGPCNESCADGRKCNENPDCLPASFCDEGTCKYQPDHCLNRLVDGGETGLNCGGSCSNKCKADESCLSNSDCISNECFSGKCNDATCEDNRKNNKETDIDCGGKNCDKCEAGRICNNDADCTSDYCDDLNGFLCSAFTREEMQAKREMQKKIIFSSLLLVILSALFGGGYYYANKKGYIVYAKAFLKNFDWKNLKLKGPILSPEKFKEMFKRNQMSAEEMRRRQMMMQRAQAENMKKAQERRNATGGFKPGQAQPGMQSSNQNLPNQNKKPDAKDIFSDLDNISGGKKSLHASSQDIFENKDTKAGKTGKESKSSDALSALSDLADDMKKKKEKK